MILPSSQVLEWLTIIQLLLRGNITITQPFDLMERTSTSIWRMDMQTLPHESVYLRLLDQQQTITLQGFWIFEMGLQIITFFLQEMGLQITFIMNLIMEQLLEVL